MKNLLLTPKMQMFLILSFIAVTSLLSFPSKEAILTIIVAFISCTTADFALQKIRKLKDIPPGAAGVSGFIIGLLTLPTLPLYVPAIIGAITIVSKHFLRVSNRHIFNPAAFGMLLGSLLFQTPISWWAVSFQQSFLLLVLFLPAFVSLYRMRRYFTFLSFLISSIVLFAIFFQRTNLQSLLISTLFNPTFVFFSLVMLPEPMTTPYRPTRQILFGILVALISVILSSSIFNFQFSIFNFFDPFVTSLLIGNFLFFNKR